MNRSELNDALTRFLDGQSLTSGELDALDATLQSMSQEEFASACQDLQADHLLRAVYFGDAENADASAERFVGELKSRIISPAVPIAPPIETTLPADPDIDVRLLAELKSDPMPEVSAQQPRTHQLARWGFVASAAAVVLVLITAIALRSGDDDSEKIAAREMGDLPSSDRLPSLDRVAVIPGPQGDVVQQEAVSPGKSNVPIESVAVAGPDDLVPATDSLAIDRTADETEVADRPGIEQPSEMVAQPKFVDSTTQPGSTQPGSQHVAVLTDSESAQWRDRIAPGKDLISGPLSLVSGVARLKLAKGTEITLEGPVDLELVDQNRVTLRSGRLEAFVPAAAVGFEVQTPGAKIVDLGTRFVVRTQPEEKVTRVDVVEGVVEVIQPMGRRAKRERKYRLTGGRTKWLSHDGLAAWDWQLLVKFGDPTADPNQLLIDGQPFDLVRPDQAALAMRQLSLQFDEAGRQISALPRGQRFAGRLVIDNKSQDLASARQLKLAQTELLQAIQKRWANNVFQQVFPQGMPAEMENFFKSNEISIPGVNR